jgi:pyridoxal/pyridoxine/pyridoxamine kinase
MKSLRVLHHAIYDHVSYRILTPVLQDSGDKTEAVIKIQLVNHKGQESFGVIRMIREDHKSWEIDGFTIIPDDDGRNA